MANEPFNPAAQERAVKAINELLDKRKESLKEVNPLHERENELLKEGKSELEAKLTVAQELAGLREGEVKSIEAALAALEKEKFVLLDMQDIDEQTILSNLAKVEGFNETLAKGKEILANAIKILEARKKDLKNTQDQIVAQGKFNEELKGAKGVIAGIFGMQEKDGATVSKVFEHIRSGDLSQGVKVLGTSILSTLNPINLLRVGLTSAFTEHVKEQETELANFARATGLANEYRDSIIKLGHSYVTLGIEEQAIVKNMLALRENWAGFTKLNKEVQGELSAVTAKLEKFGVSGATTAKIFEGLTIAAGMTADGAKQAQMDLFGFAKELGVSPKLMAEGFERALPKLAAFGDKAVEKFKGLAAVAKATGLEVEKLLSITEKFDQFDTAAQAVGNLNAILGGGYLDSIKMVQTTDPVERIKMLRSALDQSGKSWETMGYYQKKSMATMMGMSELELGKLMKGDIDKATEATKNHAMAQEKLDKLIKDAMPYMDKFKFFVASLGAAIMPALSPIIWVIRQIGDAFLWIAELGHGIVLKAVFLLTGAFILLRRAVSFGSLIGKFLGFMKSIPSLGGKVVTMLKGWTAAQAAKNAVDQTTIATAPAAAAATKTASSSMKAAVPTILAFGAAVLLIGAGVALATMGIARLALALKGMTTKEMFMLGGILFLIAGGIVALGLAGATAGWGVMILGGAILLLGAGLGIIFYTLSLLIKSFTSLFEAMGKGATFFESINKITMGTVSALVGVAGAIWMISHAISDMPEGKMITFGTTTRSMVEFVSASGNLSEAATKNVQKLVTQAERYHVIQKESRETIRDPLLQLVQAATGAGTGAAASGGGALQPIILQIDGQVLKRFVVDVMNKEMNPRKI